ncbi:MMPL family transporter [Ureibacillus sinduriensis]|uniref:Membrane protein n=1 Tax=Ureibacillus sinduriensis BLB-1 = JCM 15800 TaxID=1384057 RepID=A0A0A3I0F3_9BACL|nr:MMPL family transporter [Ureibacillus sinduriensis]KGR76123.1 membrane protein [Ureibacillus sinduriensis BLB-1 = JCM 15800]
MSKHPLEKWGNIVGNKRSRWVTVALWLLIVLVLSMTLPQINSVENYGGSDLPEDVMSEQASAIIDEQFSSDSGLPLLIVWYKQSGLVTEDLQSIQALYKELAEKPLKDQTTLPPFGDIPTEALLGSVSENGTSIVTPVFFNEKANTDTLKENLEKITDITEEQFGENPYETNLDDDGLHARFSGPAGISVDATNLFMQADVKLMITTVILILVLLVVIYRSPILAITPILVVGIAYGAISPLLGWFAENGWIDKDAQAVSIMLVLLFGAGTDYCLFLITRYREKLEVVENKFEALALAVKESGGAIVMSALTVFIGLATLGLADYGAFQRFAVPFSFAILIMGIAALTILPAILAILGRVAFWPFSPRTEEMAKKYAQAKSKPYKSSKPKHPVMTKIGEFVTNKPWLVIIVTAVVLGGLALTSTQIKYNYDLLSSFPEDMDSREGFTIIAENFSPGELAPVQIIVDTKGKDIDLSEQIAAIPFIDVVSEPTVGENDANMQLYEADLNENPYSNEAMDLIPQLKEEMEAIVTDAGIEEADESYWIGGETSAQVDTRTVQDRDESIIQPVMVAIIAILLLVYLRSVPATIYLVGTVLVSFFAALGLGWLVLTSFFGAESIASSIPLYSFVFLIALGEDYNIFMISEVWQNRKTQSIKNSIKNGVAQTGSVITSAGLILAGTFAILATLPIQVLVQFGVITAIGVLIDTFIVRPLLVPAITMVLGRYSFWPGKLFKKQD